MAFTDPDMRPRPSTPQPGVQGPAPAPGLKSVGVRMPPPAPTQSVAPVASVPAITEPAPSPSAPVSAKAPVRADDLNKFYTQQGYGPGTTQHQVDAARSQRAVGMYHMGADPNAGPAPVAPSVPPAAVPSVKPSVGIAAPAVQAQPRDTARDAIAQGLRYHQQQAAIANRYGGDAMFEGMNGQGWNQAVLQHANALANYDTTRMHAENNNPTAMLAAQKQALQDPQLRAAYEGSHQLQPGSIPAPVVPGQSPYNATNYGDVASRNPDTAGAAALLSGDSPIHEKAAMFAAIPGIENPNSPHRQLWDAFMQQQQARPEFQNELGWYNPTGAGNEALHSTWMGEIGSALGLDRGTTHRNQQFSGNMRKLGYAPAQIGVQNPAAAVRTALGAKPADY